MGTSSPVGPLASVNQLCAETDEMAVMNITEFSMLNITKEDKYRKECVINKLVYISVTFEGVH